VAHAMSTSMISTTALKRLKMSCIIIIILFYFPRSCFNINQNATVSGFLNFELADIPLPIQLFMQLSDFLGADIINNSFPFQLKFSYNIANSFFPLNISRFSAIHNSQILKRLLHQEKGLHDEY
jgi:hypothetical protein